SWCYTHCYLGVPLVRAGLGQECLDALFRWLATDRAGAALLECFRISGEGAFYHLLLEYAEQQTRSTSVSECYTRALLRQGGGEDYLRAVLSGDRRRKLR